MTPVGSLESVFKAYDVRGEVPQELDPRRLFAIGAGFARFAREASGSDQLLVARDMRHSGIELGRAFIAGAVSRGARVVDLGLGSTDLLYFASGRLSSPGAMLTASHNPAQYNGVKFCLAGAVPVGEESGLVEVRRLAEIELLTAPERPPAPLSVASLDLVTEFAEHVRSFVERDALSGLSVVADAANGMGGLIAPRVFGELPCTFELLYGELDGTFPNHPANPIEVENLRDLRKRILEIGADVGLAFDGDADRVFLVDDEAEPLSGSTTTAIVAKSMLERHPGATILYNCICSKTVREVIAENGGTGVRTRVGHSFIKAVMADTGAVFGGEHSGHYYFAENYRADSGIIAALVVLEVLGRSGGTLSSLRRPFERYISSGEINSVVEDPSFVLARVREHYGALGIPVDEIDGLTVDFGPWWFNLRSSNTEPLLRLNVEADDTATMQLGVEEVQALFAPSAEGGE